MTSSWKRFRWRHQLHVAVLFISSSVAQELLEFNGRSFSPPKLIDNGNWKPSSPLTFSEHWLPVPNSESIEPKLNNLEKNVKDPKQKRENVPLFEQIGKFPSETSAEETVRTSNVETTKRPNFDHESATWYVKTGNDQRRIMGGNDNEDHYNLYQEGYDDFDYLEGLKNHQLEEPLPTRVKPLKKHERDELQRPRPIESQFDESPQPKPEELIYGKIREQVQPVGTAYYAVQDGLNNVQYIPNQPVHNEHTTLQPGLNNVKYTRDQSVYNGNSAVQPILNNVQYIPDSYSKLKEELQPYYQVPYPGDSSDTQSLNVGASFSFNNQNRETYGQFSLPRPYFDVPQVPKRTPQDSGPGSSNAYGTYYPGYDPTQTQSGRKPLVVGIASDDYNSPNRPVVPFRVPSDVSIINSNYGGRPPFPLPKRPSSGISYQPPKPNLMNRVMDFIYNFQERQGINSDKFKPSDRPKPRPGHNERHRPEKEPNQFGAYQGYEPQPSQSQNKRPSLRPQPQPSEDWHREPSEHGKPSKQRPSYQKPNSLVDRMVETVHTYFQRGYAAKKRNPNGVDKFADGGISTAPIGAIGLAAAIASVVWYGVSKSSTPVVTARQEGNQVDMEALFENIDKLEDVIDNVDFMEKYSGNNSTFADMVQELVSHLATKDGKVFE